MKLITWLVLLLIPFLFGSFSTDPSDDSTHDITVKITNIRSSKGRIQLQVYRTGESFAAENAYKQFHISKKSIANNSLSYTISGLKTGTYGLALLDDENLNEVMDYGWVLPEEGFGFSDYYHTAWSKPNFSQFKFYLSSDKTTVMKVRYM